MNTTPAGNYYHNTAPKVFSKGVQYWMSSDFLPICEGYADKGERAHLRSLFTNAPLGVAKKALAWGRGYATSFEVRGQYAKADRLNAVLDDMHEIVSERSGN